MSIELIKKVLHAKRREVDNIPENYVIWFTTERREIRNFPYPSVFELTGRQRQTVKKRNRNVGQFLTAEVTNPGQNESQQMFAYCDWVKEIVVRMNCLTEERG